MLRACHGEGGNTGAILLIKPGKDCCGDVSEARRAKDEKRASVSDYSGGLKTVSERYGPLAGLLLL